MSDQKEQKEENQYKVIIAIKCVKQHSHTKLQNVRCLIKIQDKQKGATLPFSEGQFFDLKKIEVNAPITLTFQLEKTQEKIGQTEVIIPEDVLTKEEIEIGNDFYFDYIEDNAEQVFRGSYYIIILNKKQFLLKEEQKKNVVINAEEKERKSQKLLQYLKNVIKERPIPRKKTKEQQAQDQKDEMKRQSSQKKFTEMVESTVKIAVKEMKQTEKRENMENSQVIGQNLLQDLEKPGQLSNQVQVVRGGRDVNESSQDMKYSRQMSMTRLQTFNINDNSQMLHSSSRKNLNQSCMSQSCSPSKNVNNHQHENLTCLYYIDQATQSDQLRTQIDYYKKIIYNQQQKVDALKGLEKANERLVVEIKKLELRQDTLENTIKDMAKNQEITKQQYLKNIDDLNKEKNQLYDQLKDRNDDLNEAQNRIQGLDFDLQTGKNQNQNLEKRIQELLLLKKQMKVWEQRVEDSEKKALEYIRMYEKKMKEMNQMLNTLENQKQKVQQELNKQQQTNNELKAKLNGQILKTKELDNQLQENEKKLEIYAGFDALMKSQGDQVNQLQKDLLEANNSKLNLEKNCSEYRKQIGMLHNQIGEIERQNQEKLLSFKKQMSEQEEKFSQFKQEKEAQQHQFLAMQKELKGLELKTKFTYDLQEQLEQEKVKSELLLRHNKESHIRERELDNYLQNSNSNLLDSRQKQNEMTILLSDANAYAAHLKKLILEMQEQGVAYIAYFNDPIDKALAAYINQFHDPSRLINLFIRESEGVYLFGTKKIYVKGFISYFQKNIQIKVEQERIFIRTGGGFMSIEEFLDLFAEQEAEKLERQDPKKQYEKNKVVTKSIDSGRLVKSVKNKTSPLRNKSNGRNSNEK